VKNVENKSIILFDGVCNLCNNSVQFIIKRDQKNQFLFSSLQSDACQDILLQFQLKNSKLRSIVLIENGVIFEKSTAILKIVRHLPNFWKLNYAFIIVPKFIRDFIYTIIANNRYKWFGKTDTCMLPNKEIQKYFLE